MRRSFLTATGGRTTRCSPVWRRRRRRWRMDATSGDRAVRQRDLVPPAALAAYHVLVVGVGAVGRQVALQLAALGADAMTIVDDDTVAVENLAVQGYSPAEIGLPKVEAVAT